MAQGIDVSSFQGDITWHGVAAAGIDFAYIKATEGIDTDPNEERAQYFATHYPRIAEVGLLRGAYHFLDPTQDALPQAQAFCQRVGALGPNDLPPMLDVEHDGGVDVATLSLRVQHWLDAVTQALNVTPILYTNTPFWNTHLDNSFGNTPLWIANFGADIAAPPHTPDGNPTLPHGWTQYTIWQYSSKGQVDGVPGPVDLDYFNGAAADMVAWSRGLRTG